MLVVFIGEVEAVREPCCRGEGVAWPAEMFR